MEEELVYTDSQSLHTKLKHQEKCLQLKRTWLMGQDLPYSEQKHVHGGIFQENKNLPESFLREDDVHYETVKAFVRKGFGALNRGREYHVIKDNVQTFDSPTNIRKFMSILDEMSNTGLHLVAKLLTSGSFKFEKTRVKMKKVIKEHLPDVLKSTEDSKETTRAEQLFHILSNPQSFRKNISEVSSHASQNSRAAAFKILERLQDMDSLTLNAMHRKLRGIRGYIPQLHPKKSGWTRSVLIDRVRKMSTQMLSELGENDELQEPLAKAMSVACLSSNLIEGSPNLVLVLNRFSPEIIALQNEIAKAIWLLNGKVRFSELKNVQMILDPNAKLSKRSLRTAVKNLLVEFLFECSDLDAIPKFLSETVSTITRTSTTAPYRFFSDEEVEEEVENVLCVSAQLKQILWDLLPEYEYDHDFADAYMEDLDDSDDGESYNNDHSDDSHGILSRNCYSFSSNEDYDQIETTGETSPVHISDRVEFRKIDSMFEMEDRLHKGNLVQSESGKPHFRTIESTTSSHWQQAERSNRTGTERQEHSMNPEKQPVLFSNFDDRLCTNRNHYLDVQEACDNTSLVAYQLIGRLLKEFAQIEGLHLDCADESYLRGEKLLCDRAQAAKEELVPNENANDGLVIVQVLDELLHSFPESGKEKVKELMG